MDEEQKSGALVREGKFEKSVIRPHTEESFIAAARELQALIDDFTEKQGVGVILCLAAPSIDNPQKAYSGVLVHASLVLPRAVLHSAPLEWQEKFVEMLEQLHEMFEEAAEGDYWVRKRQGKLFVADPLRDYRHVQLTPKEIKECPK